MLCVYCIDSCNSLLVNCACISILRTRTYCIKQEKVCKKWTSRCRPRRKALPASYKRTDEEFVAQSEKDIEMERMMASMAAMGMGGSLYNRDDLGEMMGGLDDYDQEEAGMGMDPVDGDAPGQFNTAGGGYEL